MMAQRPRPLEPGLSPAHLFGARLRTLREERGLSQRHLGQLVYCSGHLIGKIEKGERWPQPDLVRRCDDSLHADGTLVDLLPALERKRRVGDGVSGTIANDVLDHLPALRRVLDTHDLPDDGPVRSIQELRRGVDRLVQWRLNSNYLDLARVLPTMLPELHRARHIRRDGQADVAALLAQAYRAADAIADKFGLHDLSARIIDLMRLAAVDSDDELTVATTAYVRAEIFFATRDWATGCRMLSRAAADLHTPASPQERAAYGALHMRAAILAARADDVGAAEGHIAEAARAARGVSEGVYRGTAFGPASVQIHRLSLAVESHDFAAALRVGEGWTPPATVPAERRSHFFVDLARAQKAAGHADESLASLYEARRVAPEHVRHHPDVKATVGVLLAGIPRPPQALLTMARWTGVLASVSRSDGAGRATPGES
jgi:DNA-binding XRE family transcriptional regulator